MSKRNTKQRREAIITELNNVGEVAVEQLAQLFSISVVTIRKDLSILEQQGLLLRRYGGAIAIPKDNHFDKSESVSKRKLAIAELAASYIKDQSRIIIDSGQTTSTLIAKLVNKKDLVVMTNSLLVANELTALENEPTVLMTGGTWDHSSESFQGKVAEQVLRSYDFDQLFIGADGLDIERGTTTFNELIGLSQVMAQVANDVIVMIESDKIGRKIPNLELAWSEINTLITDDQLTDTVKQQLINKGVNVQCAQLTNLN